MHDFRVLCAKRTYYNFSVFLAENPRFEAMMSVIRAPPGEQGAGKCAGLSKAEIGKMRSGWSKHVPG